MNENPEHRIGRTYADALVEVFSTWKLILLVLVALIGTFLIVHYNAEPGTPVEYLGVIKYQKTKPPPMQASAPPPMEDETLNYRFPKEARLALRDGEAVPILDGTLAIQAGVYNVKIVGDSVPNISIATRNRNGTSSSQPYKDGGGAVFGVDQYMELEFRKRYFAVEVRTLEQYREVAITVTPLKKPTLNLQHFSKVKPPSGD